MLKVKYKVRCAKDYSTETNNFLSCALWDISHKSDTCQHYNFLTPINIRDFYLMWMQLIIKKLRFNMSKLSDEYILLRIAVLTDVHL